MADVIMEMGGKRKRVPAEKVAYFEGKGAKRVDAPQPASPEPGGLPPNEPAAPSDGESSLPGFVTAPFKAAKWMAGGALADPSFRAGAAKFLTGGFTDSAAGLGAGAGAAAQTLADDGTLGQAFDAGKAAMNQGGAERRAYEDEQFKKSPLAYGHGALSGAIGGMGLTGAAPAIEQQIVRGGLQGGLSGIGFGGDQEGLTDDIVSGSIGTLMGAGMPLAGPALSGLKGAAGKAASSPLGKTIIDTGKDAAKDVAMRVPGAKAVLRFGKRLKANTPKPSASPADDVANAIDEIEMPPDMPPDVMTGPMPSNPAADMPLDVMQGTSPADEVSTAIQQIDDTASDLPEWMKAAKAEDWGTKPRAMDLGFDGQPLPADLPPPPPELVDHFLQQGVTREQALAQAYAVMAKQFSTPAGAVGRQRAAAPFSGEKPAPIATPKGRNRAAAPFKK